MNNWRASQTTERKSTGILTRNSVIAGAATFCAGFGAMNALYAISGPFAARGLYSYWSATLGDALALPILIGSLVEAENRLRRGLVTPRWVGTVGVITGIAVGLATQIAWAVDPDPDPNWTLPSAHTFTAAGYYHAGFTIAMSASITYLASRIAWLIRERARSDDTASSKAAGPLLAALGAGATFVVLVTLDNFGTRDSIASISTLAATLAACGTLGAAALWLRRRVKKASK